MPSLTSCHLTWLKKDQVMILSIHLEQRAMLRNKDHTKAEPPKKPLDIFLLNGHGSSPRAFLIAAHN
jgi:hypothetical protein